MLIRQQAQVLLEPQECLMGAVVDVLITSASRWSVKGQVVAWVFPHHLKTSALQQDHPLPSSQTLQKTDDPGSPASIVRLAKPHVACSASAELSSMMGDSDTTFADLVTAHPVSAAEMQGPESMHEGGTADVPPGPPIGEVTEAAAAISAATLPATALHRNCNEAELAMMPRTPQASGEGKGKMCAAPDASADVVATASPARKQQLDLVDIVLYSGVILGLAGVLMNALCTLAQL